MKIIRLNHIPNEERDGYFIKRLFTHQLEKEPNNVGFYQTTIPKGSIVKGHYHANLEEVLYFITKAKVKSESLTFSFEPGDIMILSPGDWHEIIAEEEDAKLIAVKLPNIVDDKVLQLN